MKKQKKSFCLSALFLGVFLAAPLQGEPWKRWCKFTFDKTYQGVRVGTVRVYRRHHQGKWDFAVGISGVSLTPRQCEPGEKLMGFVGVRVKSSKGGYLDSGELPIPESSGTLWKTFSSVLLKDCAGGAHLEAEWICSEIRPNQDESQ